MELQKLLGELNWLRPWLHISFEDLLPLFDLLKDKDLTETLSLNVTHLKILQEVQSALDNVQLARCNPKCPMSLWILSGAKLLMAVITQKGNPLQ